MSLKKFLMIILLFGVLIPLWATEKGTVYIVATTDCSFNPYGGLQVYDGRLWQSKLYSDPTRSIHTVMDTAYRSQYRDSFGTPMKLTWYLMGGNIFDLSDNCNVPIRSNNAVYLFQKYHLENASLLDDRVSIHYHNYLWFDSDGDGTPYWNQGMDFNLSEYDYEQTLCKYLIENNVFPISFRSGWHYMDNAWQAYEERFVPFDFSNAAPFKNGDTREPSWAVDWSESPLAFAPYHPNADNYQIEGDLKQWRLRSVQFQDQARTLEYLTTMYQEAAKGNDQMICVWGHPAEETSFLAGLQALDANLQDLSSQYDISFKYCKDSEAMRLWMNSTDTIPPEINIEEIDEGDYVRFRISSDEPIFQQESPFFVIKTRYEQYERFDCSLSGTNQWETDKAVFKGILAKVALAVSDTLGNQTTVHLNYIPDDIYIDDADMEYSEISGNWSSYSYGQFWNLNSRQLNGIGGAEIVPDIQKTGYYKLFLHAPASSTTSLKAIVNNTNISDTVDVTSPLETNQWSYIGTFYLETGTGNTIILQQNNSGQNMGFDVLRLSPLVVQKDMILAFDPDLGDVTIIDTTYKSIAISNSGYEPLTVNMSKQGDKTNILTDLPLEIGPQASEEILIALYSETQGSYSDTLILTSDDPMKPVTKIPLTAEFVNYMKIVDNDDPFGYLEFGDDWHTSSATAYGPTTRYAWYRANGQHADFTTQLSLTDTFDVQYIVPETANAMDHADYIVIVDGTPIDTVVVDQNENSGDWVTIGTYLLPQDVPIIIRVQDNGKQETILSNTVLRSDAVRIILQSENIGSSLNEVLPEKFHVSQNYPNPFNPGTVISFDLPEAGEVYFDFFDINGRKINKQIRKYYTAGKHDLYWEPHNLTSGIYFYRLKTETGFSINKCTFIK